MNDVHYLIISSTIDYSTDLICCELEKRNCKYLRINRNKFSDYKIIFNLNNHRLFIEINDNQYIISSNSLKGVYFRAPVFLRNMQRKYTLDEQLFRSQWSSFIRNLIYFDKAIWINNPVDTYRAENKLFQLKLASEMELNIPETFVCNCLTDKEINVNEYYIVKSLDTALFYDNDQEFFTYSTEITGEELLQSRLTEAPIILQNYISPKIDIRVTIVGDKISLFLLQKINTQSMETGENQIKIY